MISSMELELQNPGIDVKFLPRSQSEIFQAQKISGQSGNPAEMFLNTRLPFMTVERMCIKFWEYSMGNAVLKRRIHIK